MHRPPLQSAYIVLRLRPPYFPMFYAARVTPPPVKGTWMQHVLGIAFTFANSFDCMNASLNAATMDLFSAKGDG